MSHGTEVVEDCLSLLANLLRLNAPNQSHFRETGCVKKLTLLLANANHEQEAEEPVPPLVLAQRDKNVWGLLVIIQLFLVKGGVVTPANQLAFWNNGVMEQVLSLAFSQRFSVKVMSKVCFLVLDQRHRRNSLLTYIGTGNMCRFDPWKFIFTREIR